MARERGHDQPVRRFQPGTWYLTVQNRYLVTQYQQLDVLGRLITTTQHDQRQQPADHGIDEREHHHPILADGSRRPRSEFLAAHGQRQALFLGQLHQLRGRLLLR
jgi:hypothetical protein